MMKRLERLWASPDFRRFLAIALGVFLGYMIQAYVWGFSLTEDALLRDAAGTLSTREASDVVTTDIGDARILSFETGGQYGYASYVRHPVLPLYKRTGAYLDYKPISQGDTVYVEDFSKTYIVGHHDNSGGLAAVKSYDYTSLGFNWLHFTTLLITMGAMLFLHNKFTRRLQSDNGNN